MWKDGRAVINLEQEGPGRVQECEIIKMLWDLMNPEVEVIRRDRIDIANVDTLTTIQDTGTAPLSIKAAPSEVTEGAEGVFTVSLCNGVGTEVKVELELTDRQTTPADDYTVPESLSLTFAAGVDTSQQLTIITINDTDREETESLIVKIARVDQSEVVTVGFPERSRTKHCGR